MNHDQAPPNAASDYFERNEVDGSCAQRDSALHGSAISASDVVPPSPEALLSVERSSGQHDAPAAPSGEGSPIAAASADTLSALSGSGGHYEVSEVPSQVDSNFNDRSPVTTGLDKKFFGTKPCPTPEIDIACRKLIHWLRTDSPGAVMSGEWRTGKSSFCDYMHQNIERLTGGTTFSVRWSTLKLSQSSDIDWLRDRLRQANCDGFNHTSRAVLIHRLKDGLRRRARASGASRIVCLIDEAQLVTENQLSYLGDVHNELTPEFSVFMFLAGQPELSDLSACLKSTDARNTALRFFNLRHHFAGIKLDQLEDVLNSLDRSSGSSAVTRHFPALAAQGWRLGDAAIAIADAFESVREDLQLLKVIRLPMELIRGIANDLLYRMDVQRHDPLSCGLRGFSAELLERHAMGRFAASLSDGVPSRA